MNKTPPIVKERPFKFEKVFTCSLFKKILKTCCPGGNPPGWLKGFHAMIYLIGPTIMLKKYFLNSVCGLYWRKYLL